jgi:hypothetical protein
MWHGMRSLWLAVLPAVVLSCLLGGAASAQDSREKGPRVLSMPAPPGEGWAASSAAAGYTVWRKNVSPSCIYADHDYILDIPVEPAELSDITYSMNSFDVDYGDAQSCEGGAEVDAVYVNGHSLGTLNGADESWSVNSWPLTRAQVLKGANSIRIDTDAPGTGCWCVGVGYIEVRAKVGFSVKSHTPQKDDKNRDFHAGDVDLTVTFGSEYDASTLTSSTFKLEYRDAAGSWTQAAGGFTPLAPERFRFVPDADLKDGVRYRVTVKGGPGGVQGKHGGELSADEVWYFHTVPDLSLSDAFDYGDGQGSRCPPAVAPCTGVEVAVFQVSRNAAMVPGGKDAVARVYLRWKNHVDVHVADQVKELDVDASIRVDGANYSQVQKVKRPDQYTAMERELASNTVNIKHTPKASFNYVAEVMPKPQTNAKLVKYLQHNNLGSTGHSPRIQFNYYALKDGNWSGGIPAADLADGINVMTAGSQFVTDQFPVLAADVIQKGELTIGYGLTGRTLHDPSCGLVQEVACPSWLGATNMAEYLCVYSKLRTLRGGIFGFGEDRFAAATVPNTLCAGATAFAMGGDAFMHQAGTGANDGTVAHEVGHLYGASAANTPTWGHRNDSTRIEGFHVRAGINRSFTENPTKAISLMHTTLQPQGTQWIDDSDYTGLAGAVSLTSGRTAWSALTLASGPYLIVSGFMDVEAGQTNLDPLYLQAQPNDLPALSGVCSAELVDELGVVVASDSFTPGVRLSVQYRDDTSIHSDTAAAGGAQPFSVSLPWPDLARMLRLSCHGTVLFTQQRSARAPQVDFIGLANGAKLTGTQSLRWQGGDADGPKLAYRLELSEDGGANWTPLTALSQGTGYGLNTSLLSSGPKRLRVLVTDGFDSAWATRSVTFVNPLRVQGTLPLPGAGGADPGMSLQAAFVTPVNAATLTTATFQLLEKGKTGVAGKVSYDPVSRVARFVPGVPLKPLTSYTAMLGSNVQDVHGNRLGSSFMWSFTTAPDTTPPLPVSTSPANGALDVPLDALVQVRFSEPLNPSSVTGSRFQVLDGDGYAIQGLLSVNSALQAAVFLPSQALAPEAAYTVRVSGDIQDLAGNPLGTESVWSFSTGSTATQRGYRIVGNYRDQAVDTNGDGLFDNLTLSVEVEVRALGRYNLNGRLLDSEGTLLEWTSVGEVLLDRGVHPLNLAFKSAPLRSNGRDGPYTLDSLSFYRTNASTEMDVRYNAYQTYPYQAKSFFSVVSLGRLPPQELEWNTAKDNAFNLRDYTTHATLPVSSVVYRVLSNTDPRVAVSIDPDGFLDIAPSPGVEAESDVTIQAQDPSHYKSTSTFRISVRKPPPAFMLAPE